MFHSRHPDLEEQLQNLSDRLEIVVAEATDTQETHMPDDEFLTLLGFPTDIHQFDLNALYKACFEIQDNPAFKALSSEQRIAALQTGNTVMTNMRRGKLFAKN